MPSDAVSLSSPLLILVLAAPAQGEQAPVSVACHAGSSPVFIEARLLSVLLMQKMSETCYT
jgi:hypothetical protein